MKCANDDDDDDDDDSLLYIYILQRVNPLLSNDRKTYSHGKKSTRNNTGTDGNDVFYAVRVEML
jgi:hypothetical protein